MAHDLRQQVAGLRAQGWRFRRASARHHAVWDNQRSAQLRLRAVVLPDRGARLTLAETDALLRHRLEPCALALPQADPALLESAALKIRASLAPGWLRSGRPLDLRDVQRGRPCRGADHELRRD